MLTDSGTVAVSDPAVPVMVAVADAGAAELLAVRVSVLLPPAGLGERDEVTPLGRPLTAKFTGLANPFCGTTMTTEFAELPGLRLTLPGAAAREKFWAFTVSAIVVEALRLPDVPVIVTTAFPGVAALLAVNVSVLLAVVGFGEKATVTPLGSPDAASVTDPANPY